MFQLTIIAPLLLVACASTAPTSPETPSPETPSPTTPGPALHSPGPAPAPTPPAPTPPAPGPMDPAGPEAIAEFLSGKRFRLVGGSDWVDFRADGTLAAMQGGELLEARWAATMDRLSLSDVRVMTHSSWVRAADRAQALGWLDGKLNVSIDGANYRTFGGAHPIY